jgi:4-amino-4-deoxy-L-arabinose transferase-like glycosyltransferase
MQLRDEPAGAHSRARRLLHLAASLAAASFAYLYGLNSILAPTIGDESYYIQIARVTAGTGHWLPLVSLQGITNTKPPLLFWQGILSTGWGSAWELWRLRLPIVAITFTVASLVLLLAWRRSGNLRTGALAGLIYLGFWSTVQHGRPYLTNGPETLFLFAPLVLVVLRETPGLGTAVLCGLSFGIAALYKSFLLVVPGTAGIALVLLRRSGFQVGPMLRRHGLFLIVAFGAWLFLDPRPDLIVAQFILGENAEKFGAGRALSGLFGGPYPLWRIWAGDLSNAGVYALLIIALLVDLWRRRRELPVLEQELWLYVLAFLVVYSFPAQRQENYILPTCAALSVLLALRWEAIPTAWFRATLALVATAGCALPVLELQLARTYGAPIFGVLGILAPLALGIAAAIGAILPRFGRAAFPYVALGVLVCVTAFLTPFARTFPPAAFQAAPGGMVLFPDQFEQEQEMFRFALPGVETGRYACPAGPHPCVPKVAPPPGHLGALILNVHDPLPPGYVELGELPHLYARHSTAQILEIVGGRYELLIGRLVLVRAEATAAAPGPEGTAP